MKLLLHLLAADARRFRLMIALWLAVAAASTVLEGMRPMFASEMFATSAIGVAADLVWIARVLLAFVSIPLIVQTHPLVGSDAFWMTRPIPPRTLLLSKLVLLAAAIIVVPVVCELALMIAYKVPPRTIAAVAVATALGQAGYLAVVMAFAALTRNLARFALLSGGALLALAAALVIGVAIAMSRMDDAAAVGVMMVSSGAPSPTVGDPTSGIVFGLIIVAAALALLMVQYVTRSTRRSAPVGVAGLAAAWIIASLWPWPLLRPRLLVPEWAAAESALRLIADPESVEFDSENPWNLRKRTSRLGRAVVRLEGIQPGWLPSVRVTGAVLELNPEVHLSSPGFAYAVRVPIGSEKSPPLRGVLQAVLGVGRVGIPDSPDPERAVVFMIRETDFSRHSPAAGAYHGRAAVELTREEVVATLPVAPGAAFQDGAYRVAFDDVRAAPRSLGIRARISDARSPFGRRPTPMYTYYLRNRRRGEAVGSSVVPLQHYALLARLLPGFAYGSDSGSSGFSVTEQFMRFPAGYGSVKDRPEPQIDDAWIGGAEIVVVRATGEGSVPRPLEIPNFPLH